MKAEHSDLRRRIETFAFDDPAVSFPFSARLAQDNGWSRSFALRAIEEYRRFAFLAVAAGHPVSPSDVVDQVWHEHLTYTRSYWQDFCGRVLERPLHHEPTRGGEAESAKFADWYERTLASYRTHFGEEPPADIWPAPAERATKTERFVRANLAENWLVPKPSRGLRQRGRWLPLALPALALAGCGSMMAAGWNPLNLAGPDFLGFYAIFTAVTFGVAWVLRGWLKRVRLAHRLGDDALADPYAIALLSAGPKRVVQAALARLAGGGELVLDAATKTLRPRKEPSHSAPKIERSAWACAARNGGVRGGPVGGGATLEVMRSAVEPELRSIRAGLVERGLLLSSSQVRLACVVPIAVAGLAPLLGVAKIFVGLDRGRPVGFLVVEVLITAVFLLIFAVRWPFRSSGGDRVLARLRNENFALQTARARQMVAESPAAGSLGVALFGSAALAPAGLLFLGDYLEPRIQSRGDGTILGGSSCSSSGSGNSCGGGGGGGGSGCGGCSSGGSGGH